MASDNKLSWVIVVLLVLIVAYVAGYDPLGSILPASMKTTPVSGGTTSVVTTTTGGSTASCPDSTVTMTVGKVQLKYTPSTDLSARWHRVFTQDGSGAWVDQGLKKDGSTMSVKVGSNVIVIYDENGTNAGTGTSAAFEYASAAKMVVPCGAFSTSEFDTAKEESKLYDIQGTRSSRYTLRATNTNDNLINDAAHSQSISSNDVKTMKFELEGASKMAVSPYGDLVVVIEGNKSDYDSFALGTYAATNVPPQHMVNSTANRIAAFRIPGGLIQTQIITTSLTIDSGATWDPGAGNGNITVTIYDENYFRNTVGTVNDGTGAHGDILKGTTMFFGVADNDNNDVGVDEGKGLSNDYRDVIVVS